MFRNCGCNRCCEETVSESCGCGGATCGGCGGGLAHLFSGGNCCWIILIIILLVMFS